MRKTTLPGFTANASLCTTMVHDRSAAIRAHCHEVVPQAKQQYTYQRAKSIKDTLGIGSVICMPDCSVIDPDNPGPQFCGEKCYWVPY